MDKTSLKRLSTCHPDLIRLFEQVDKTFPSSSSKAIAEERLNTLRSRQEGTKLDWPKGKHNSLPSYGLVDAAPLPLDWAGKKSREKFYLFAGFVLSASACARYLPPLGRGLGQRLGHQGELLR